MLNVDGFGQAEAVGDETGSNGLDAGKNTEDHKPAHQVRQDARIKDAQFRRRPALHMAYRFAETDVCPNPRSCSQQRSRVHRKDRADKHQRAAEGRAEDCAQTTRHADQRHALGTRTLIRGIGYVRGSRRADATDDDAISHAQHQQQNEQWPGRYPAPQSRLHTKRERCVTQRITGKPDQVNRAPAHRLAGRTPARRRESQHDV